MRDGKIELKLEDQDLVDALAFYFLLRKRKRRKQLRKT